MSLRRREMPNRGAWSSWQQPTFIHPLCSTAGVMQRWTCPEPLTVPQGTPLLSP